jgi:hypothetical protein
MNNLEDLVGSKRQLVILGTGWIGKLMYYGLLNMGVLQRRLSVVGDDSKSSLVKWNVIIYDSIDEVITGEEDGYIIVSDQEDEGKIYAKNLENKGYMRVCYISDKLKNEMEEHLMRVNPEEYEKEVLVARKQELDLKMDANVKMAIRQLKSKADFLIFQSIEIETINRCNGTCSFCPINCNDDPRTYKKMSTELFEKIIDELSNMSYDGRVNLFSNNEPLIDNRIIQFAEYTNKKLPMAQKIIFTNGTLLNKDNFQKLLNYIDLMCIDIYYDDDVVSEIPDNLREVLEVGLEDKKIQNKTMIQFIRRTAIRNNRGGQSKNRHVKYMVHSGCLLPYIQIIVRPDGKISLCCNDPIGINTLGDVSVNTLLEIWNSSIYTDIREKIGETRQNFNFCKECDNFASFNTHGKAAFSERQFTDAWERAKYYLES